MSLGDVWNTHDPHPSLTPLTQPPFPNPPLVRWWKTENIFVNPCRSSANLLRVQCQFLITTQFSDLPIHANPGKSMPILVIPMPIPSHYWGHSQAQPRNKRSIRDGPWSSRRMNLVQIHQWKLIQKSAYKSPSKNNISNCIGSALAWNPTAIGAHFGPEKRRVTAAGK